MFLLDTNVVSELRKARSGKANAGLTQWARETPTSLLHLSVISLYELEKGVCQTERSDRQKGAMLREWLESVVRAFAGRILDVDAAISRRAAELSVPDPLPVSDALIGATAIVSGMSVVTRNVVDFRRIEALTVINPWS